LKYNKYVKILCSVYEGAVEIIKGQKIYVEIENV
jgi:hypothetical protein